jgi:hypothetical protein
MRTEVKDFMRMCERLMGLALQTGELSAEECDILSYYAKELHQTTHPLCDLALSAVCREGRLRDL